MKDAEFNAGVTAGILEAKHIRAMTKSWWLFIYFVHRQSQTDGKVLGGKPIKDDEIAGETGMPVRKVRTARKQLLLYPYITARRTPYGFVYVVKNPKKRFKKSAQNSVETRRPTYQKWSLQTTKSGNYKQPKVVVSSYQNPSLQIKTYQYDLQGDTHKTATEASLRFLETIKGLPLYRGPETDQTEERYLKTLKPLKDAGKLSATTILVYDELEQRRLRRLQAKQSTRESEVVLV